MKWVIYNADTKEIVGIFPGTPTGHHNATKAAGSNQRVTSIARNKVKLGDKI